MNQISWIIGSLRESDFLMETVDNYCSMLNFMSINTNKKIILSIIHSVQLLSSFINHHQACPIVIALKSQLSIDVSDDLNRAGGSLNISVTLHLQSRKERYSLIYLG